MNIVLCESAEKRVFTAGNKARTDTVRVLVSVGYRHIPLFTSKERKSKIFFQMILNTIKAIALAGNNDTIFIQYPYYPSFVNKFLIFVLSSARKIRKYKITVLVHDVVGLRDAIEDPFFIREETSLFNKADTVIVHNEMMKNELLKAGGKDNYKILGPFDYFYQGKLAETHFSDPPVIVIAGNLDVKKSAYVNRLNEINNCNFNLYGINYSGVQSENVRYRGSFPPEKLIENLDGSFGLVWDGDDLESCTGKFGNYLRYNNPHKFSLYIAAGLPLIVWDDSALAGFVKEFGLGICVHSLKEIEGETKKITFTDYETIISNVKRYRLDIIEGNHLRKVVFHHGQE